MNFVISLFLLLFAFSLEAKGKKFSEDSFTVKKVKTYGFSKTKPYVIGREFEFEYGKKYSKADIEKGLNRLKNTRFFYDLKTSLKGKPGRAKTLKVYGKDRWTTIPILKFTSGGGVNQFILGAYDPNVLGRYFELGGQYERLGDTNSGVVWYRQPWLFGQRITAYMQAWSINRTRTIYDNRTDTRQEQAGFLLSRKKFFLSLKKEWTLNFKTGVLFDYESDSFSEEFIENDLKVLNKSYARFPSSSEVFFVGGTLEVGNIQFNKIFLLDGLSGKFTYKRGISLMDSALSFDNYLLEFNAYKSLMFDSTLAFRGQVGSTSSKFKQYEFFLGGFDGVRGFVDGRFSAKNYWLANLEFRIPVYSSPWVLVQPVGLADFMGISENFDKKLGFHASSVGAGFRLILPKVFGLVARFDYAYSFKGNGQAPISFGFQQFF